MSKPEVSLDRVDWDDPPTRAAQTSRDIHGVPLLKISTMHL